MKFISNRIHVAPVSMEDAVAKAKEQAEPRSLDDILASIDAGNRQVKTASKETKETKETEETKEVVDEDEEKEAAATEEVKTAELEVLELSDEEEAKYFGDEEEGEDIADHEKATPLASSSKTLKVARKADFRGWNAEDVVKAWGNYGSVEKCVAATDKLTSDPKVYCGLLQVASSEAMKLIKSAAKCDCGDDCADGCKCVCHEKEETACASTERRFRKIAKLTGKDLGLLRKYFGNLYGESYVTALLDEYAD
jgi:hypothetical protein